MSRLLEVADLCSRTLSDPANRLLKRTDSEGSSSAAEKKSSAVPFFAAVTCRQSAPDYPRERGDPQEGGNRRCLPSCAPARRQRRCLPSCAPARRQRKLSTLLCPCRAGKISSLRKRHSAVLHQNAKEEHCCLAVSLFAHITVFCFPDFSAVRHWPHGGALLRSPEALSPALQRTRVSPGRCAYTRDSRSYPRTDRAFSADD